MLPQCCNARKGVCEGLFAMTILRVRFFSKTPSGRALSGCSGANGLPRWARALSLFVFLGAASVSTRAFSAPICCLGAGSTVCVVEDEVSGVALNGFTMGQSLFMDTLSSTISERMRGVQGGQGGGQASFENGVSVIPTSAPSGPSHGIWVRGYGGHATLEGSGDHFSFEQMGKGVNIGFDFRAGSAWTVGIAFASAIYNLGMEKDFAKGEVKGHAFALYAQYLDGPVRFEMGGEYGFLVNDMERVSTVPPALGQVSRAHFQSSSQRVYGELGYRIESFYNIEPIFGLSYTHLATPDYQEQGGGVNISVEAQERYQLVTLVGAQWSSLLPGGGAMVTFRALWGHDFGNFRTNALQAFVQDSGQKIPLALSGVDYSRDYASLAASIQGRLSDSLGLTVGFEGVVGGEQSSQSYLVGLSYFW